MALLILLESLTPAERCAFLLHDVFGYSFAEACEGGRLDVLIELLDPQVVFRSDGGGAVPAARTIFIGAERVARIALAAAGKEIMASAELIEVNGTPGLMIDADGLLSIVAFTISHGRIGEINTIRNPAKLRHIPVARS